MKKLVCLMIIFTVCLPLLSCGPYRDYAGTYTRTTDKAKFIVTMSASGEFKWERKLNDPDAYDPTNNNNYNIREGTYSVKDGKITINFSYYSEIEMKTKKCTATARLSGKKLIISNSDEIQGTFTKR